MPSEQRKAAAALVALCLIWGFNFLLMKFGLNLGGTGKTAGLVYTMPFWVLVFAWLVLHEQMSRWQGLAVAESGRGG